MYITSATAEPIYKEMDEHLKKLYPQSIKAKDLFDELDMDFIMKEPNQPSLYVLVKMGTRRRTFTYWTDEDGDMRLQHKKPQVYSNRPDLTAETNKRIAAQIERKRNGPGKYFDWNKHAKSS